MGEDIADNTYLVIQNTKCNTTLLHFTPLKKKEWAYIIHVYPIHNFMPMTINKKCSYVPSSTDNTTYITLSGDNTLVIHW